MWCNHCQQEVTAAENSDKTGTLQCPQCDHKLELTEKAESASIAQTAHALLKRWEESRPVAQAAPAESEATDSTTIKKTPLPEAANLSPATELPNTQVESKKTPLIADDPKTVQPQSFSVQNPAIPEKRPKKVQVHQQKSSPPVPTLAAQNDASSLLKRDPDTISRLQNKTSSAELEKQTEAAALQNRSEISMKKNTSDPISQTATSQGRLRFAPTEEAEETIDDLGIQQAIERHHRKEQNWSVLFGQFMVYCGAIVMTAGIGIVIASRFGSLTVAESTGWLTLAGGHLLFVLGIYTHISSKLEQLWNDQHRRADDLSRLIIQQQKQIAATGISSRKKESNSQAGTSQFQRGALPETVREIA